MFETFTKKPFKDRLKDTGFLIKTSFTIIGKDEDIKKPTIHMIVFSMIINILIFFLYFLASFLILLTINFVSSDLQKS